MVNVMKASEERMTQAIPDSYADSLGSVWELFMDWSLVWQGWYLDAALIPEQRHDGTCNP